MFSLVMTTLIIALALIPSRFSHAFQIHIYEHGYNLNYILVGCICISLLLTLVKRGSSSNIRLRIFPLNLIAPLIIATPLLSYLINGSHEAYTLGAFLKGYITLLLPFSVFYLFINLRIKPREIYNLLHAFVFLSILVALLGIAVAVFALRNLNILGWSHVTGVVNMSLMRAATPVGGGGMTAIFLAMIFPFVVANMIITKRISRKILYAFALVFLFSSIILCQSRAPIISLIVSSLIMMICCKTKVSLPYILILIATYSLMLTMMWRNFELSRLVSYSKDSDSLRFESIKRGFEVFSYDMLFGSGMGQVFPRDNYSASEKILVYKGNISARDPHNFYVLLLSEAGLFGIGLFFVFMYFMFRLFTKRDVRSKVCNVKSHGYYFCLSIMIFLIFSFFSSSLALVIKVSTTFWLISGLGVHYLNCRKLVKR